MTVLHGSAVSNSREAICFVADSGVGKSSMAGLFIAEGYRLVSDELIVLKLEDNNAIILPSSSYLYLSENSYQKVSLSQFPSIPSLVQFRNDYKEKLETKICVDLKSVCTSKPINCKKIIILNRNEQNKVSLSKYKKLEAYMKLIYYLYTPIVFPFMRKNLSAIMNFIETEQIFFSDCFSQFTDIKQHVEEN